MGFLDDVIGNIGGGQSQGGILDLALNLINSSNVGGLAGLVQMFKDKGLAEVVNSWVSTGQNLPISGEQIQRVLGGDQIGNLASGLGLSSENLSCALADLLPKVVDGLTPEGRLPDSGGLEDGIALLKKSLFSG
jgi:uncharacterized protein YidB (DUF937 family)